MQFNSIVRFVMSREGELHFKKDRLLLIVKWMFYHKGHRLEGERTFSLQKAYDHKDEQALWKRWEVEFLAELKNERKRMDEKNLQ